MRTAILPLAYLPPVSWFAALVQAPDSKIELHDNFVKQTYRNRARILTAAGPMNLIVPVRGGGGVPMKETEISFRERWQLQHWRAIESAYGNSPYYVHYKEVFEAIITDDISSLAGLNLALIGSICDLFGIKKPEGTVTWEKDPAGLDLRELIHPKTPAPGKGREYFQVFSDRFPFMDDLSIIDLIFNLGPDSLQYLQEYRFSLAD